MSKKQPLKFKKFITKDILLEDDNLTFTIRGLTRSEYYQIMEAYSSLDEYSDLERLSKQKEIDQLVLDLAIVGDNAEQAKKALNEYGYHVISAIVREVLSLSTLGEEERKNF